MKRKLKRRRFLLFRPVDALLPLAFLAGDLFTNDMLRGWVFAAWLAVQLCGLFTADAVRMAYAVQPGMRQVKGSTTMAAVMQIAGAGLVTGLYAMVFHGITPFTLAIIGIGLLLNIEHVFYEYLIAEGDRYSANLCAVLTAALLAAGMLLDSPGIPLITLGTTGAAALITLFMAVVLSGYRPVSINSAVFMHAPRATVYGLLYPAAVAGMLYAARVYFGENPVEAGSKIAVWTENGIRAGFFAGLAVQMLARTPFRRSALESRRLTPVMLCVALLGAAAGACAMLIKTLPVYVSCGVTACAACIAVSAVISLILWANFRKEV